MGGEEDGVFTVARPFIVFLSLSLKKNSILITAGGETFPFSKSSDNSARLINRITSLDNKPCTDYTFDLEEKLPVGEHGIVSSSIRSHNRIITSFDI